MYIYHVTVVLFKYLQLKYMFKRRLPYRLHCQHEREERNAKRVMLDARTAVSLHAEGGHFVTKLEPPSRLEALGYQTAACVALDSLV